MGDTNRPLEAGHRQFTLGKFLFISIVFGSAIGLFVDNYNSIWGSVNEPDKYPETWKVLEQYRQFWFGTAIVALVAGFIVPRSFRNCLLFLFAVAFSAGLYNFLLPLGML